MVEEAVLIDNGYFKEVTKEIFNNKLPKIDYLKLSEEIFRKINKKDIEHIFMILFPGKVPILQKRNRKGIQKLKNFLQKYGEKALFFKANESPKSLLRNFYILFVMFPRHSYPQHLSENF